MAGVVLPLAETVRRRHELSDLSTLPFWFDDWLIGAFLLYGAWRTRAGAADGRATLAAAWAFACGMGYASLFSQLSAIGADDPSGLPSIVVVGIKAVMLVVAIVALHATLKRD